MSLCSPHHGQHTHMMMMMMMAKMSHDELFIVASAALDNCNSQCVTDTFDRFEWWSNLLWISLFMRLYPWFCFAFHLRQLNLCNTIYIYMCVSVCGHQPIFFYLFTHSLTPVHKPTKRQLIDTCSQHIQHTSNATIEINAFSILIYSNVATTFYVSPAAYSSNSNSFRLLLNSSI